MILLLAAYVLNSLVNHIDSEILREHWAGEGDVLYLTSRILQYATKWSAKGCGRESALVKSGEFVKEITAKHAHAGRGNMNIDLYQVDAFTDRPFHGNPAAICPLESWLSDELMQAIAAENNLSETAFLVSAGNRYQLRWFTPVSEVDLCGHATLAAAFVVFLQNDTVRRVEFDTRSGLLAVEKDGAWFRMDFPAWTAAPFAAPALLFDALRVEAKEIYKARDVLVVLNSESEIKAVQPDFALLEQIDALGVVVSARGTDADLFLVFLRRVRASRKIRLQVLRIRCSCRFGQSDCIKQSYWRNSFPNAVEFCAAAITGTGLRLPARRFCSAGA
jgi:hypothetical protein